MSTIKIVELETATVTVDTVAMGPRMAIIHVYNMVGECLSGVLVSDCKPLTDPDMAAVVARTLYIQSWNTENVLTEAERAELRAQIAAEYPDSVWYGSESATHSVDLNGIIGGIGIMRVCGKDVSIDLIVGCPAIGVESAISFDVTKGPVHFAKLTLATAEFVDALVKIQTYAITRQ